jgi:hypothetical protein
MVRAKSFAVPSGSTAKGFFELEQLGQRFGNRSVATPDHDQVRLLPMRLQLPMRSFFELATTMSASQFSENQEDSAGKLASARVGSP